MNIFIGSFFVILILGAICKKICNGKKCSVLEVEQYISLLPH